MTRTLLFGVLALALCNATAFADDTKSKSQKVTFSKDIAAIIFAKCTSCHRPGQTGPFSLVNYRDVSKRAETLRSVINDRSMPPWQPSADFVKYRNERRLSDGQIRLFNQWVDAGTPIGDEAKIPKLPKFPEGWQLGEPDLIVDMKKGFSVPADGPDVYRSFVFPVALPNDKWVKAVELRPKARSVVHHAIFFLDNTGTARQQDGSDGKPGIKGMGFRITGVLGGYVPGSTPNFLPGDLAMPMTKGSDIVMQTHFHPSGKAQVEQATIGLYFADKPPEKQLVPIMVPPVFSRGKGISIPAGEDEYIVTDEFKIPVDVEAVSIGGHAHYICRTMKMTAELPDGTNRTLLSIGDWNLDWQDRYYFDEFIKLPAGTIVRSKLVYDNSAENPNNPNSPPKRIRWGQQSTDEMGAITLLVTASDARSSRTLRTANRQYAFASLMQGNGLLARFLRENDPKRRFPEWDKNKDGQLKRNELPILLRGRFFDRLDINGDGKIERSEVE